MPLLIGEPVHFIFDGRAVSGTNAFDLSAEEGRPVEVGPDHLMSLFIRIGQPAADLSAFGLQVIVHKREGDYFRISVLREHLIVVQALGQRPCRCSCFEAAHGQSVVTELSGKFCRGCQSVGSAFIYAVADEHLSAEECSRCQDHCLCQIRAPGTEHDTACLRCSRFSVLQKQVDHFSLFQLQKGLPFQSFFHFYVILILIGLRPKGMDRRAFGCVEHTALDEGLVYIQTHFSAESIDLSDQMAFAGASDGRVACHHSDRLQIDREHQCLFPEARAGKTRFTSGMACSDHDHIVFTHLICTHILLCPLLPIFPDRTGKTLHSVFHRKRFLR